MLSTATCKHPPRLLQICLSNSWGGLEMAAYELAKLYHDRGVYIKTVCPSGSKLDQKLKENNVPTLNITARKYFSPSCIARVKAEIERERITNVVLQQLKDIWHARPALAGHRNVRLTGFAHIFLSVTKHDILHRWLYGRMDALICLTEIQKENFASALPIRPDQIVVIPNSIDLERFCPSRRSHEIRVSLGVSDDTTLVGVIGRLDEAKGQMEAVEAARLLKNEGHHFKLVLVGEDTLNLKGTRERLERKIKDDQLEDIVKLAGFRADIPEIIASLDVLAMPSYAETFGRVVIEAMASKTPVLATSSGGVPDLIEDGVDGLLVSPRNSEGLAAALRRYVTDPDLRGRVREAAFKKVYERYDVRRIQNEIDQILLATGR